jgi:hypothetical protein
MKTGGYDLVIESNEKWVNKLIGAAYYMGKFPAMKGSYALPFKNVPVSLVDFITIGYDVQFGNIPIFDFMNSNKIAIALPGLAASTVLGGIKFTSSGSLSVKAVLTYNKNARQLSVGPDSATLSYFQIGGIAFPKKVLDKLNEILSIAMTEYFTNEVSTISISPVLYSLSLPSVTAGTELTITLGNINIVSSEVLAISFDILRASEGNMSRVVDFTEGTDFAVAVSENAMHKVFDFWWANTTYPKSFKAEQSSSFDTSEYDKWIDWLLLALAVAFPGIGLIIDAVAAWAIDITGVRAEYGTTIRLNKPNFNLLKGNRIRVQGKFNIDIWARLYLGIRINYVVGSKRYNKRIASYTSKNIPVSYSGEGTVYLDGQNRLMADIGNIDISIGGPLPTMPEFLLDAILPFVSLILVDNLPPICLSSSLTSQELPNTKLALEIRNPCLETSNDEAILKTNLRIRGLENYCSAPYVANNNSREVHTSGCGRIKRMSPKNMVSYFFLDEALQDGYDGCWYCLRRFSRR